MSLSHFQGYASEADSSDDEEDQQPKVVSDDDCVTVNSNVSKSPTTPSFSNPAGVPTIEYPSSKSSTDQSKSVKKSKHQHDDNNSNGNSNSTKESIDEGIEGDRRKSKETNANNSNSNSNSKQEQKQIQKQIQIQIQKQKQKQKPQPKTQKNSYVTTSEHDLPDDLLNELERTGYDISEVDFVDVNPRSSITAPTSSNAPSIVKASQNLPKNMIHKTADRIAKSANVSRLERRRHQITALAAEAQALQVARNTFPTASSFGRGGRRRR